MLAVLAEFLGGLAIGTWIALVEDADARATATCADQARQRVDRLRTEADERVGDVYRRWGSGMSPDVRRAYAQRLR